MMKKPQRSPWGILKIAMLIPAVLITLGLTTGMTPQQKTIKGKIVLAETGEAVPGASIVIRNSTSGCVSDLDGTFRLNVDGDPELVISFVGMETLIVKASEVGKKPLKLKVETYDLDLESVSMEVKKEASGTFSIRLKDGSDAQPVFVVDGKEVQGVDHLDPEQIESISVIKDPNDPIFKKYDAKDGVILITTKEPSATEASAEEPAAAGKQSEMESFEKDEEVFYIVEDMPKFPGGKPALKTYIYSNLEYPEKAKDKGIEGEAKVRFLINNKGKAVKAEVLSSTYEGFEAPALKVINEMPHWTPGKQRGKPVQVWYVVSIKFSKDKK